MEATRASAAAVTGPTWETAQAPEGPSRRPPPGGPRSHSFDPADVQRTLGAVRPRRVPRSEPDPVLAGLVDRVDPARVRADIEQLSSLGPRDAAGLDTRQDSGNARTTAWLRSELAALGYHVSLQPYANRRFGQESNVIAEKRGTKYPDEVVVVVAHFDDVGHAQAGADDNASGTAGLLEMARVLAGVDTDRTIRFVAVNGEEDGLRGSEAYVGALEQAGTLHQVKLALVLDMIGYNDNGIVDIETSRACRDHAEWLADHARTYTTLAPRLQLQPWGSDHVPFLERDVPALLSIEHWPTRTPCYHAACDKPGTLRIEYAAEVIRMNLAALAQKAGVAGAAPAA